MISRLNGEKCIRETIHNINSYLLSIGEITKKYIHGIFYFDKKYCETVQELQIIDDPARFSDGILFLYGVLSQIPILIFKFRLWYCRHTHMASSSISV